MAYVGLVVPIPMGGGGLYTDDSPSQIPPGKLIAANNVSMHANLIEKIAGATRFNTSGIPSGVLGAFDFWPTPLLSDRRLVVLGGDGKTYQIDDTGAVSEITPSGGAPATLGISNQAVFVAGGNENASAPRKLFLFTPGARLQKIYITGGALTRSDISFPAADWDTDAHYPTFGVLHRGILFCGGSARNPHILYGSVTTNQENFQAAGTLINNIYPGESERLNGAMIYKGKLFAFKYPTGVYPLVDDDITTTNWYFQKSTGSFGFATPHSVVDVLNDTLIKNASDSINSVTATLAFGSIAAGDVLTIQKIEQFIRDNTNPAGNSHSHCLYYPEKKLAMFTYQGTTSTKNDRILMFRVDVQGDPKASFLTAFEPNCLALRKDSNLIQRPIYGSTDGYVYLMDQTDRNVNGSGYNAEFQTPHLDFGFVQLKDVPNLTAKNKHFDFLELRYVPEGDWNVFADVYIDGNFSETLTFPMSGTALLGDSTNPTATDFMLGDKTDPQTGDFLADPTLITSRKRLRGTGRTISVRIHNSGVNQTFKIATMIFSFRVSGEQQH